MGEGLGLGWGDRLWCRGSWVVAGWIGWGAALGGPAVVPLPGFFTAGPLASLSDWAPWLVRLAGPWLDPVAGLSSWPLCF